MAISLLLITVTVFSVAGFPSCFSTDKQYEECRLPLRCGSAPSVFPNITYPFWGINKPNYCGQSPFQLSCKDYHNLTLTMGDLTLRVVIANLDDKTIIVADESLVDGGCPKVLNFKGNKQFTLNDNTEKIGLFDCPRGHQPTSLSTITCQPNNGGQKTYHVFKPSHPAHNCREVGEIPMLESAKNTLHHSNDSIQALKMALGKGFKLRYAIEDKACRDCSNSTGICGSESRSGKFRCLCEDKPHKISCAVNDPG